MNNNISIVFQEPNKVEMKTSMIDKPGPREILFKSRVSLMSTGTETFCLRGEFDAGSHWDQYVKFPFKPGYCMVGEIIETGNEVTAFKVGDRIFAGTNHQRYTVLDTDTQDYPFLKVPEDISDEVAVWSALSWITQTAVRRAEHSLGDTAVVIGLGPLGQLITQYLKLSGLKRIIAVDTAESRLHIAEAHGATHIFAGTAGDAEEFVRDCTDGEMADVVYDVTGHYSVLPQALKLPKRFGKLILLGDSPQATLQHLTHDLITRQLSIIGSHNIQMQPEFAHWTAAKQALLFMDYVRRGLMKVDNMITHKIVPEEAVSMYTITLQQNRESTMGVLIDWRSS
jgi:2-desacetyl-2-hydroxyethyl bacteriochlorophyllide A dehydrogenase